MDNMVAMLEKYAGNLEDIVAERTKQLMDEKKKTDTLLYQMLPKYCSLCYWVMHNNYALNSTKSIKNKK